MTLTAKFPLLIHVAEMEPSKWFSIPFSGAVTLSIWYDLILHTLQNMTRSQLNKHLSIFDAAFLPQRLSGKWLIFFSQGSSKKRVEIKLCCWVLPTFLASFQLQKKHGTLLCECSTYRKIDQIDQEELGEVSAVTCRTFCPWILCKLPLFNHSKTPEISFLSSHSFFGSERSSSMLMLWVYHMLKILTLITMKLMIMAIFYWHWVCIRYATHTIVLNTQHGSAR